jgi:hypothetical protein
MAAKKASRKKATKKKAAKKKVTKKKTAKKKPARSKSKAAQLTGSALPKSLSAFAREFRRDLNSIEKEIESASRDARRGLTRVMRDASHQLGVLEARGQKEWRAVSKKAQAEIQRTVTKVKRAAKKL